MDNELFESLIYAGIFVIMFVLAWIDECKFESTYKEKKKIKEEKAKR